MQAPGRLCGEGQRWAADWWRGLGAVGWGGTGFQPWLCPQALGTLDSSRLTSWPVALSYERQWVRPWTPSQGPPSKPVSVRKSQGDGKSLGGGAVWAVRGPAESSDLHLEGTLRNWPVLWPKAASTANGQPENPSPRPLPFHRDRGPERGRDLPESHSQGGESSGKEYQSHVPCACNPSMSFL